MLRKAAYLISLPGLANLTASNKTLTKVSNTFLSRRDNAVTLALTGGLTRPGSAWEGSHLKGVEEARDSSTGSPALHTVDPGIIPGIPQEP